MSLALVISAGVMAFVSAYIMFKISERNREAENQGVQLGINSHNALQILFFFMVIASLVLLGRAGMDSGTSCSWLVNETTIVNNVTSYDYANECVDNSNSSNSWIYRLPLYLAYLSGLYLIVYFLLMIVSLIRSLFNKGDDRG